MIRVVVRCSADVEQALASHWSREDFIVDVDGKEGNAIAGVVHGLPTPPIMNWSEQTQDFLDSYFHETKEFVQQLGTRVQRPSVCIVLSSSAVYGSREGIIEEGHSVANNVWADFIVQYENLFTSLDQVGIRVVYIRSGVVLAAGRIPKTYLYAGKKEDWVSWISQKDLCRFIDYCMRSDRAKGMYHLASSNWVQKFSCLKKRKISAFSLIKKFIQGESIFSPSQKIVSQRIMEIEFCLSEENIVKSKN